MSVVMISKLFSEKLIERVNKNRSYIFQNKIVICFLFVCLAVLSPLVILLCKDGIETGLWFKAVFYALIYLGLWGAFFSFLVIDISKQKFSEKEKRILIQKLVQVKKSESLGILAGTVAHDLNNILTGIGTYPDVLMMDKTLDPKIKQGLDMIKDSGIQASTVVRDLLTITQGSQVQMERVNINSILECYVHSSDFKKIKKDYESVTLELIEEPELKNIQGSYLHIEKIIMNLFLNAAEDLCHKENGQVIIETKHAYIDSSLHNYKDVTPKEYVVLSVLYKGSLITKEDKKKIFDPFFITNQKGKNGSGLGLTLVWYAVQDHDGYINVTSDKNGTCFELLFPADCRQIS